MQPGFQKHYPENMALNINNNLNFNQQMDSSSKFETNKRFKKNKEEEEKGPSPQDLDFDIYGLGEVKYAVMHRDANIPLKQIEQQQNQQTQPDLKSCPCCNYDLPTKGYLEQYSICENPDNYYTAGQGVVLYYSFLKYIIIVLFIASICISGFNIILSLDVYNELTGFCEDTTEEYDLCKFYSNESVVDSFFFRFSSVNIKDYRELYEKINSEKDSKFNNSYVNFSRLNFGCLIFLFFFNLFFIFFLFNKSRAADFNAFTVSDYSVFMYNLYDVHGKFLNIKKEIEEEKKECNQTGKNYNPDSFEREKLGFRVNDIGSEIDQFKEFVKQKICKGNYDEDFKINRIDFSYKIGELKKLQDKLNKKIIKITKVEKFPEFEKKNTELKLEGDERKYFKGFTDFCDSDDEKPLSEIKEKKKELEKQINEIIEKAKKDTIEYFGGAAFVTFDTVKEQELYMKNIPDNAVAYFFKFMKDLGHCFCSCCDKSGEDLSYLKRNVKFEDAPEPEDIIFENLEVSSFSRAVRTIGIYIISILICGISFLIIYFLNKAQENITSSKETSDHITFLYVLSLAISVVTSAIDVILEILFQTFTEWEKQTTMTNFYLSYSVKLTIFTFLNSALLPLLIEKFFNEYQGYEILISNMLMKFLINAFVSPIMWTLSVSYYLKKIQICLYEKEIIGSKTQKDLNALYELPPMNVSAKYSYIFKTLLMTFLYIPIFPLGIIISFLGFAVAYWLEKINFAHYYKRPEMLNKQLCEFYVSYFVVILFAYGVGDYIFLADAHSTQSWSLVNIIVFGVLIIIPYHKIFSLDFIEFKESEIYKKIYNEVYVHFNNDYERANPMTKQEGDIRYETERKNKGLISKEQYEENIKLLNNRNNMALYFNRRQNNFGSGFMGNRHWGMPMRNRYPPQPIHGNQNNQFGNNNQFSPYKNQIPNQTNTIPATGPTVYNSQRMPPQQMNQPINNQFMFKPQNTNFSRPSGYSGGNFSNNVNVQVNQPYPNNNAYYPGNFNQKNFGYSSHS